MIYWVCVLDFETRTIIKQNSRACATMEQAERLERAMLINLDIERYYTRIDGEFPTPDEGSQNEC
jgi:hypothetical protein